jgi:hypothetical protein
MTRTFSSVALLFISVATSLAQERMAYENRNQIDYGPLVVRNVSGVVVDRDGIPVPGVDIGIFSEERQELVLKTTSDSDGYFMFKRIPRGKYRLVSHYDPFCPANVRITIARWPRGGLFKSRRFRVNMVVGGIDVCSWVAYK